MIFLINASDLKAGGGLQVADSICLGLGKYPQHHFIVVLSSFLNSTAISISGISNVEVIRYDTPKYGVRLLLTGRDSFLDSLVAKKGVQAVLSIFGPTIWVPKCPHISGFARAQLLVPESPYFLRMNCWARWKQNLMNKVLKFFFKRSSNIFYTENPFISERLKGLFPQADVYTITNYYNQVFEQPDKWIYKSLPPFEGPTFLCITAPYPHKNLPIAIDIAKYWQKKQPGFQYRFVFTIDESSFPTIPQNLRDHFLLIGKVDIAECPSLYEQCTVAFQPTLLECFTATYPEAMYMGKPIVTTDLDFAKGLCGNAACYYSATDPEAAAEALFKVVSNPQYASELTRAGKEQLFQYDSYEVRVEKMISLLEKIAS